MYSRRGQVVVRGIKVVFLKQGSDSIELRPWVRGLKLEEGGGNCSSYLLQLGFFRKAQRLEREVHAPRGIGVERGRLIKNAFIVRALECTMGRSVWEWGWYSQLQLDHNQ